MTNEARAKAQAALDGSDPKTAQSVIEDALAAVAPEDEEDRALLEQLLLKADKEAAIAAGKAAEEHDPPLWHKAVDCYRNANAEAQLQRVLKKLSDQLHALHDRALQTHLRPDRDALRAALRTTSRSRTTLSCRAS